MLNEAIIVTIPLAIEIIIDILATFVKLAAAKNALTYDFGLGR
jgi:hypothetical protein